MSFLQSQQDPPPIPATIDLHLPSTSQADAEDANVEGMEVINDNLSNTVPPTGTYVVIVHYVIRVPCSSKHTK